MPNQTSPVIPARLIRVAAGTPQIDLAARTVRSVIATRLLALDGGIVIPEGINTKYFEQNPVVLARHGLADGAASPVIGRSLGLARTVQGMESTTQFAETDLGREYAYLYGVNEKSEVFMRAWSFGWRTLASESWSIDQARLYLGDSWDPVAAIGLDSVWVATQSEMHEYSAVPVGADRAALSRALAGGIRAAGEIIAGLDLADAAREIAALKTFQGETSSRIGKLEAQIQALVRNGAAAVDQRNSAEVLAAVRDLIAQAQSINKRN